MKEIGLTQGFIALVDDEDYERVSQFKWWTHSKGYAATTIWTPGQKQKTVLMHRFIRNPPIGIQVDHKDHNKLNNQRDNLRVCTASQNEMNKPKRSGCGSRFKGVCIQNSRRNKYYVARIYINGQRKAQYFPLTEEGEIAASETYKVMAKKYYKEFACNI